jgi:large subunit ribosomal protein L13
MKTYSPKASEIERAWWVVDATDTVLGRLAADVARVLRGKHKPTFAPHLDTGDFVIVVNASKVRLTGDKLETKKLHRHSGYPGGLTSIPYSRLMNERPEVVVEKAIKGMLPRNRLGRAISGKLKVYAGPEHPHKAQKPKQWTVGQVQASTAEGSSK